MPYRKKIDAIHEYLRTKLPGCEVDNEYNAHTTGQTFRVIDIEDIKTVNFSRKFLDDNDVSSIFNRLNESDIAERLRKTDQQIISVE